MHIPNEILNIIFVYKHQLLLMNIHKELKKYFFQCNFCNKKKYQFRTRPYLCPNCLKKNICKDCFFEEEMRIRIMRFYERNDLFKIKILCDDCIF